MAQDEPKQRKRPDGAVFRFRCPRCSYSVRLYEEHDRRDCPRCQALMRRVNGRPREVRISEGAQRTVGREKWDDIVRCKACGGLHWHSMSLVKVCPLAGK